MKAICNFPKTVLVLGPSGSGKDTQIDKLVDLCGYEKIGTGDMLREEYAKRTTKGIEAHKSWGEGRWVPDDLMYELFSEWITKYDRSKPWIFSQVVRAPGQVAMFDDLLGKLGRKLDMVLYFSLSSEAAIERMSLRRHCPVCGREYHLVYVKPRNGEVCDDDGTALIRRDDDYPEAIEQRLEEFKNKVVPILSEYTTRGILTEVDASPSIDDVWKSVKAVFCGDTGITSDEKS